MKALKKPLNEQTEEIDDEQDKYFDFGTLSKGIIMLGVILLFIYGLLYLAVLCVPEDSIWEDSFMGAFQILTAVVGPTIIILVLGGFLYLFHLQFVKLAEFAEEVESGEFERKCLKELEDETENNGTKSTD